MSDRSLNAMLNFGRAALKYLQERGDSASVLQRRIEYLDFSDKSSFSPEHFWEPDYRGHVLQKFGLDFLAMPEAAEALHVLIDEQILQPPELFDSDGKKVPDPSFDQIRYSPFAQCILFVVIDYLEQTGMFSFDPESFKESYTWFENRWLEKIFTIVTVFPLLGFDSEVDQIDLTDRISIETLTPEEKTQRWNPMAIDMGLLHAYHFAEAKFKLYGKYQQERFKSSSIGIEHQLKQCITALRLLHSGEVGVTSAFEVREPPYLRKFRGGPGGFIFIDDELRLPAQPGIMNLIGYNQSYHLTSEEVGQFIDLWKKLDSLQDSPELHGLHIGLRWFNRSYSQKKTEDKIISFIISLESTLLFGTKDELKYRLSLRGAELLKLKRNPEDTFILLGELYDVRSSIVHDGLDMDEVSKKRGRKIKRLNITKVIEEAEQITREILSEYVSRLGPHASLKTITKGLDKAIVNALVP